MNVYHAESVKEEKCTDSKGMILIALISGGDYDDAGVPGCRVKIACDATRATLVETWVNCPTTTSTASDDGERH